MHADVASGSGRKDTGRSTELCIAGSAFVVSVTNKAAVLESDVGGGGSSAVIACCLLQVEVVSSCW